jgi:phosphoribosylamine--glycine ligase
MLTPQGPRVLEFNCRFGDPETQPLMMQLDEDLLPLLAACAAGRLEARPLAVRAGASVGVVLAAEGYPQSPRTGDVIEGLDSASDAQIFHAGTRTEAGRVLTSGGRVLTVCAHGDTLSQARDRAYAAAGRIQFRGMHYRRDIGAR